MTPHPISLLYDIGPAVHQRAGLARYAERLATQLAAEHSRLIRFALFYNTHSGHTLPPSLRGLPAHAVNMKQIAWRLSVLASQMARVNYRPIERIIAQLDTGAPALYHATEHLLPRLSIPTVLTVHDLIFERYPDHHTRRNMLYLRAAMPAFVRAATSLIAVSKNTKRDLVNLYSVAETRIHVVYEGIDASFFPVEPPEVARIRARYSPDRPYLLMVGTLEPRKNHVTALRAMARLKHQGHPHRLLIVGGEGWLFSPIRALVERLGLDNDVTFAGFVPQGDLPALYTGSSCLLQPSLYEGFGFPVLEAMACEAPVVASNVSSLPELAGDAALLVPPTDDAALASAVSLVLTQPDLANALSARGRARAATFTWTRAAAETMAVYEQTLAQTEMCRKTRCT